MDAEHWGAAKIPTRSRERFPSKRHRFSSQDPILTTDFFSSKKVWMKQRAAKGRTDRGGAATRNTISRRQLLGAWWHVPTQCSYQPAASHQQLGGPTAAPHTEILPNFASVANKSPWLPTFSTGPGSVEWNRAASRPIYLQ